MNLVIFDIDGTLTKTNRIDEICLNKTYRKAKEKYSVQGFNKTVYVGDGIWDLNTCKALKIPFVGIDASGDREKTKLPGNFFKLKNYQDADFTMNQIETAIIPE
ncbi:MAG: hypothetical protein HY958_06150 [Bacteroidia bacterium]|nr:hypothetical protein [Bacteroidia bacterium]